MRLSIPRWAFALTGILWVLIAGGGCSGDRQPTEIVSRPDNILQEPFFKTAFSLLGDVYDQLTDPAVRAEMRLHLLAGRDAWAWKRLGYTQEELGAFLARLELLRPGLESRWPELLETSPPAREIDPRRGLVELLGSDVSWPRREENALKTVDIWCAIDLFFSEYQSCVNSPVLHDELSCIIRAYWIFVIALVDGCPG